MYSPTNIRGTQTDVIFLLFLNQGNQRRIKAKSDYHWYGINIKHSYMKGRDAGTAAAPVGKEELENLCSHPAFCYEQRGQSRV